MLDCFPEQQQALLAQLEPHPQQQFAFLKGLVALHQAGRAAGQAAGLGGNGSLKVTAGAAVHCRWVELH